MGKKTNQQTAMEQCSKISKLDLKKTSQEPEQNS